jgi:hypothetical protein
MESLIPFIAPRWRNECLGFVERDNKQEGSKNKKIKRRKRGEKELQIIRKEVLKPLAQFTLNRLNQGYIHYQHSL